jgi:hypothetical protein
VIVDRVTGDGETSCTVNIPAGDYEWKITASNERYTTREEIHTLRVVGPPEPPEPPGPTDISGQTVRVIAPVNGAQAETGEVTFLWNRVDGASSYHITVVGPSFANANRVILDRVINVVEGAGHTTSVGVHIPAGTYEWKVVASNEKYRTQERIVSLTVVDPAPLQP